MIRPTIIPAAEDAWLVSFGDRVTPAVTAAVRGLAMALAADPPGWIRNWRPAYTTMLVDFDPLAVDGDDVRRVLESRCSAALTAVSPAGRVIDLPVCYEPPFAPDLADVAAHTGLSPRDIVARHAAGRYPVLFLGFMPGFAYLDGLDPALTTPRLASARPRVPAGSVGIGGGQTGVYPVDSPGGWRLIGRTPMRLFDPAADRPVVLSIGDVVRFVPIDGTEFARRQRDADTGNANPGNAEGTGTP